MKKLRMGFVQRLVLAYALVLLVLLGLLFGTAYLYVLQISEQGARVSQEQLLEKISMQVNQCFNDMRNTAEMVRADPRLISTFSALQADESSENHFDKNIMDAVDTQSRLLTLVGPSSQIWRVIIVNHYGDLISTDPNIGTAGAAALDGGRVAAEMDSLMAAEGQFFVPPIVLRDEWTDAGDLGYIVYACPLTDYYSTEAYAVIEVHQTLAVLEGYLALDVQTDTQAFLFDREGAQIYPFDRQLSQLSEGDYTISRRYATDYGWSVALAQSRAQLTAPYRSVLLFLALAAVLILIFLFIIIYFITKSISKPLVNLTGMVRHMSIETLPTEIEPQGANDEIKELTGAFSAMLGRLNDAIALERKAYLLALQSQIDPHFLYNSLSTISSMALAEGNDNIVGFSDKLSAMLRYSTAYDNTGITLASEIENARNYLELMHLRYEDNFSYAIEVDEALLAVPIPKLTLQPILENCFAHGFKNVRPPWHIALTALALPDRWVLSVKDNGGGITEQTIAELFAKVEAYSQDLEANYRDIKIGGMGLLNTIIRLRLSAGPGRVECRIRQGNPTGTEVILEGCYEDTGADRRG